MDRARCLHRQWHVPHSCHIMKIRYIQPYILIRLPKCFHMLYRLMYCFMCKKIFLPVLIQKPVNSSHITKIRNHRIISANLGCKISCLLKDFRKDLPICRHRPFHTLIEHLVMRRPKTCPVADDTGICKFTARIKFIAYETFLKEIICIWHALL